MSSNAGNALQNPRGGKQMIAPDLLLTVGQAASRLNLSERTGWNLVRTGRLPSVKIGKSRRVPAAALERFVEGLAEGASDGS